MNDGVFTIGIPIIDIFKQVFLENVFFLNKISKQLIEYLKILLHIFAQIIYTKFLEK